MTIDTLPVEPRSSAEHGGCVCGAASLRHRFPFELCLCARAGHLLETVECIVDRGGARYRRRIKTPRVLEAILADDTVAGRVVPLRALGVLSSTRQWGLEIAVPNREGKQDWRMDGTGYRYAYRRADASWLAAASVQTIHLVSRAGSLRVLDVVEHAHGYPLEVVVEAIS